MKPFTRNITTRGYELDADSMIPPVMYLRYFEHLRWLAVASQMQHSQAQHSQAQQRTHEQQGAPQGAGHILGSLFGEGHSMVVVAQSLLLDGDVSQGVTLSASLWIRRVGRTSLDFGHLMARPDGSPLARAVVTAVYRGPDGQPTPVPDVIRQQVLEDPVSWGVLFAREKIMQQEDPPPPGVWARPVEVRPSDIDLLGHLNHANYLSLFDDTRRLAVRAGALPSLASRRMTEATLEYRQQAVVGDPLVARVWLSLGEGPGVCLAFDLHAQDILLARAWITLS